MLKSAGEVKDMAQPKEAGARTSVHGPTQGCLCNKAWLALSSTARDGEAAPGSDFRDRLSTLEFPGTGADIQPGLTSTQPHPHLCLLPSYILHHHRPPPTPAEAFTLLN